MLPQTDVRDGEIDGLRRRIDQIRGELYQRLTPWQRVLVARHPERPYLLDYVDRLFTEFVELHGVGASPTRRERLRVRALSRRAGPGLRPPEGRDMSRRCSATSATPAPRATARRSGRCRGDKFGRRSSSSSTPRPPTRGRVGRARHRRGHCRQPARHGHSHRADHRRRHRRGRQRRRPRPGHRRSGADPGVRRLQRHPARGLRRHPVARCQPQGRGRRSAEDHGA